MGGLQRWGRFVARNRWVVLAVWLVALVAVVGVGRTRHHDTSESFSIPGSDAQRAVELLKDQFSSQEDASAKVVFHGPAGSLTGTGTGTGTGTESKAAPAVDEVVTAIRALPEVADVGTVYKSSDGSTGYVTVTMKERSDEYSKKDTAPYEALVAATRPAEGAGLEVAFGGSFVNIYSSGSNFVAEHADDIGIGIAVIVLLLSLGSVVGMLLPIGTALLGAAMCSNAVLPAHLRHPHQLPGPGPGGDVGPGGGRARARHHGGPGHRAWWFPRWLEWLPHLDVEGTGKGGPVAPPSGPSAGDGGTPAHPGCRVR